MSYAMWILLAALSNPSAKPQPQSLPGVTIMCSDGQRVVTDANGDYSITVTTPFTGTLTPVLSGYTFMPSQPSFTALKSDTVQDFTAKKAGGPKARRVYAPKL